MTLNDKSPSKHKSSSCSYINNAFHSNSTFISQLWQGREMRAKNHIIKNILYQNQASNMKKTIITENSLFNGIN